ncbi:MAG: cation:proton antiporter [Fimbriimonadaceae bacterium]|nr:cation:proton antiporter [Fimbriimonadaceae bacterium]
MRIPQSVSRGLLLATVLLTAAVAWGAEPGGEGSYSDPVAPVLLELAVVLVIAKLSGALFLRGGQPAVLGELIGGVLGGNALLLWGHTPASAVAQGGLLAAWGGLVQDVLAHGGPLDILARVGVVLLLFTVGLESDIGAMLRVGPSSLLVATVGVVCPFVLGFFVSQQLLPGGPHHPLIHVFIGATLCATSVGITARVLQELGRLNQDESRIVLGAAVIDDVMGLVILAVVAGMIGAEGGGEPLTAWGIARICGLAVGFLVVAVLLGRWMAPRVFRIASRLLGDGLLVVTAFAICFLLAGLAGVVGLAPIVGAFAAGLLLDEVHFEDFRQQGVPHRLEELVEPVAAILVPLFFVQMGMSVDLRTFANPAVLGFAVVLTAAAVVGKQACGLAVLGRGLDRLSVGVGMIPRGEVGLIFASIGRSLTLGGERVIGDNANAAVVIMVIVTTMLTPPILAWTLRRGDARRSRSGVAAAGEQDAGEG